MQALTHRPPLRVVLLTAISVLISACGASAQPVLDDGGPGIQETAPASTAPNGKTGLFGQPEVKPPDDAATGSPVVRSRIATVNLDMLPDPNQADGEQVDLTITLNLFEDTVVTAVLEEPQIQADGQVAWTGRIEGVDQSNVRLKVGDGTLEAEIHIQDDYYLVRPIDNGLHEIYEVDSSSESQPKVTEPPNHAGYEDLLQVVQEQGTVGVIVTLDVPFQPEGELPNKEAVQAQREAIARAQDDLIALLSEHEVTIVARYTSVPQIALVVDEPGLRKLIASPLVKGIQENAPDAPSGN